MATVYLSNNIRLAFRSMPLGTSLEPWRGSANFAPLWGFSQISCSLPCLNMWQPAAVNSENNWLYFTLDSLL